MRDHLGTAAGDAGARTDAHARELSYRRRRPALPPRPHEPAYLAKQPDGSALGARHPGEGGRLFGDPCIGGVREGQPHSLASRCSTK